MTANKPALPNSSANLVGSTDLARLDAHSVQAGEYDELPEITAAWIEGADHHVGGDLVRRGRGRPKQATTKQQITLRLDPDVISGMRATGPGWQVRVNEVLRGWLAKT